MQPTSSEVDKRMMFALQHMRQAEDWLGGLPDNAADARDIASMLAMLVTKLETLLSVTV